MEHREIMNFSWQFLKHFHQTDKILFGIDDE